MGTTSKLLSAASTQAFHTEPLLQFYEPRQHGLKVNQPFAHPEFFLNFELSWLDFNWRVFAEAGEDGRNPLMDRFFFLSVTASNLDEFFQKRVGALKRQMIANSDAVSVDGRQPQEQIAALREVALRMRADMETLYREQLIPELTHHGFEIVEYAALKKVQQKRARKLFAEQIFPLLTPLSVDPGHPFPFISNFSLSLAVEMRDPDGQWKFARVKIPPNSPRFVNLGKAARQSAVLLVPVEQIIEANVERLFPGMKIEKVNMMRVTRDAEGDRDQESADDLLDMISEDLRSRKYAPVVRLELTPGLSERALELVYDELEVEPVDVYEYDYLLGITDVGQLTRLPLGGRYRLHQWQPQRHPRLQIAQNERGIRMFDKIRAAELLVHYPYYSFDSSYMEFLKEACVDPKVMAIKLTLYRSTVDWEGFRWLRKAAEDGKQVAVLVELQARFDEERNIAIARSLEDSGVHVMYGVLGLKTHSKITLVVRQEGKHLRKYVHIGTGNYNPDTARLYEDLGLYTSDPKVGEDALQLLNFLTGAGPGAHYQKLWVAPRDLRDHIRQGLLREMRNAKAGKKAWFKAKMNALEDPEMIQLMYRASAAGVKIDLVVRGVCRLIPGKQDLSEHIRVRSIIGRFLEHARIYAFANDGDTEVYIGSADVMRRNLDNRVEVIVPVQRNANKKYLLEYFNLLWRDNVQSWELHADGSWTARRSHKTDKPVSVHETMMRQAEGKT